MSILNFTRMTYFSKNVRKIAKILNYFILPYQIPSTNDLSLSTAPRSGTSRTRIRVRPYNIRTYVHEYGHGIGNFIIYKKLYCAFIDFKKAFDPFDSISRNKLWYKLISNGINGNILSTISNLYKKAKSCVKHPGSGFISEIFPSQVGVRQGDNFVTSPLFYVFE